MSDTMALLFPHVTVTDGVVVRVAVSYLAEQSSPGAGRWFWSYHIRIENRRDEAVQLIERSWKISDGEGRIYEVRGEGVVGEMPLILPGDSFDYVSGCPLGTSSGAMQGSYRLVDPTGATLEVAIPRFNLTVPTGNG